VTREGKEREGRREMEKEGREGMEEEGRGRMEGKGDTPSLRMSGKQIGLQVSHSNK